ncbi:FMN-linked oxidoreductase [Corynespora cassiicola Philippines]|uniref:FMN-linked oxidoreductase n=1 Tax=Corynespora cassiicola Philippines TaxID=1448308 RepID=A0A2T2N107_CORCC|nr:FMN-linked oxidoreductase [Corynespora cassiicola Philippines]
MVNYTHLEAPSNPIIFLDADPISERFEALSRLAATGKQHCSLIIAQVGHAGRQTESHVEPYPISASDVPLFAKNNKKYVQPRLATIEDIERTIESFSHAAEYLEQSGSDFILGIKLNSVELQKDGFILDEARQLCDILQTSTFGFVKLSGGTYEENGLEHKSESIKKREALFVQFAETITPVLSNIKSHIIGLHSVPAMVGVLEVVDGIGLGRPSTHQPRIGQHIVSGETGAARPTLVSDNDFPTTLIAAAVQIRLIGQDQAPVNLAEKENYVAFVKDIDAWYAMQAQAVEKTSVRQRS